MTGLPLDDSLWTPKILYFTSCIYFWIHINLFSLTFGDHGNAQGPWPVALSHLLCNYNYVCRCRWHLPLLVQVRKRSKACRAGLREGDELVSINESPCGSLSHAQAMTLIDSSPGTLHIRVKRSDICTATRLKNEFQCIASKWNNSY